MLATKLIATIIAALMSGAIGDRLICDLFAPDSPGGQITGAISVIAIAIIGGFAGFELAGRFVEAIGG